MAAPPVALMVAVRAEAQAVDRGNSACYIRVEGQSTQDLTALCARQPGSSQAVNRGNRSTAGSEAQVNDCDPDDDPADCQAPISRPVRSSNPRSPSTSFPPIQSSTPVITDASPADASAQAPANRSVSNRPAGRSPRNQPSRTAQGSTPGAQPFATQPFTVQSSSFTTPPSSFFPSPATLGAPVSAPPTPTG